MINKQTEQNHLCPEYLAWFDMIQKCENPDYPSYPEHGGRGIKVCERWHKFENFIADMGPMPRNEGEM